MCDYINAIKKQKNICKKLFLLLFFFTLCSIPINLCNAPALATIKVSEDIVSSNTFEVSSPKETCYNTCCVFMNFSLTSNTTVGTICYSLDNETIQGLPTKYANYISEQTPFRNISEKNPLILTGNQVFENLKNGKHTLRIYLGHQKSLIYEVTAFTEINFLVTAPAITLTQETKNYQSGTIPIELVVSEPSSIRYSMDNANNITINGNTTLTNVSKGNHNLTIYATNHAGECCASNTVKFNVENQIENVNNLLDNPLFSQTLIILSAIGVFILSIILILILIIKRTK